MDKFDWNSEYDKLHNGFAKHDERPLIGISGNYSDQTCTLAEGYYRSVLNAGGIPMIIPPFEDTDCLGDLLDKLDAIIFSGGGDINPLYLGEEPIPELHGINPVRDRQELLLAKMAYDRQIPMLGICKGIQIITAALGGKLYQDIYSIDPDKSHKENAACVLKHSQDLDRTQPSHYVTVDENSMLFNIYKVNKLAVNSFHHQAVMSPAPGFKVSAVSCDGVIEAIESTEHKSIIGVQWHPECFVLAGDNSMMPLFCWLKQEAAEFHEAKKIHQHIISLDSHCDTPMFFHQNINIANRDSRIQVDLHKMSEGHLDASIMVAYLEQGARDDESLVKATQKANLILDNIEQMAAKHADAMGIARNPEELYELKRSGKRAVMMGVENGYAIGKDIKNVEAFRNRGVVYITLCHNGDNDICDSAKGNAEHNGVSDFGAEVIREMNRVGLMVDLSHASEKSFYDAIDISSLPIVCSHSSCRALCDHPRNLTDDQLRRLAESGGVAQVTLYNHFLNSSGTANIHDVMAHINHMIDIMGVDHVGIGTDFDGSDGETGLASACELINITRQLLRNRYNETDIEKIWGGNFLRLMKKVQSV